MRHSGHWDIGEGIGESIGDIESIGGVGGAYGSMKEAMGLRMGHRRDNRAHMIGSGIGPISQ